MSNAYKFLNPDGLYYKGLKLFAWVIMSNHIHFIGRSVSTNTMSDIMRDFLKKHTSLQLIKVITDNAQESRKSWMLYLFLRFGSYNPNNEHFQFWQQDNHPIELCTMEAALGKLNYLHNNPVKAGCG